MKPIEINTRPPLEGELNINYFVELTRRQTLLGRVAKDNPRILRSIAHEYDAIGFTRQGGTFRRRTPTEQLRFAEHASQSDLRVIVPLFTVDKVGYFSFLDQAHNLDDFLENADQDETEQAVFNLFYDLRNAHSMKIIYGDRWSQNILVLPENKIMHIDFDIEISGRGALEFEVAQVIYYTLCGGKEKALSILSTMLARSNHWFDINLVQIFLEGHTEHFKTSTRYGGVQTEINSLLATMCREIGTPHKK